MRVFRATRFFVDFFDGQKSQSQSRLERQCLIENQIININQKSNMKYISIIISLIFSINLNAQEILFPGLKGDSLITELKKYYTPKTILPYDQARTKLYNEVFLQNDSLECFYSGYKIPVPSGTNILSWTARYGIQTEHLFPRSLGSAAMPALSDSTSFSTYKSNDQHFKEKCPIPGHSRRTNQVLDIPGQSTHHYPQKRYSTSIQNLSPMLLNQWK
jgi:hypothetical protein